MRRMRKMMIKKYIEKNNKEIKKNRKQIKQ